MDYTKDYFVDLFAGSMVVSANIIDKYEKILINDIIEDVIGIHKSVIDNDDIIEIVKVLSNVKDDQDAYNKLRESYNIKKTPEKLWALILSCNSNLMRFNKNGEFNQTWGRRGFNKNTQKNIDIFTERVRPHKNKIIFTSKNFNDIKIHKPSMVYMDPPYSNTSAGYNLQWNVDNDIKLYNYCKNLDKNGTSFMLSGVLLHNGVRCVLLDKLISDGFRYKELNFDYNKVSKKGKKETKEIIIMNY